MLKYQNVFVPGGFPHHTYNPRKDLNLESRLAECKDNLCKLVTVTGHTKSGKTVLARKVLPPEEAIWIDGGAVSHADEFWQIVVERLDLFQNSEEGRTTDTSGTLEVRGSAGANFLVAKGTGEIGGELTAGRGTASTRSRALSSRIVALRGLSKARIPLVIDDFHYLPRDLQGGVIRALKPLIFDGLPVVAIAIPHRRYDAVKVEREMTGRILSLEIPVWTIDELSFIPKIGFDLLNHHLPTDTCVQLSHEAIGSPHLMQDFCRGIARSRDIEQSSVVMPLVLEEAELPTILRDVAETIGRPVFERLARGPRQRTDRVERKLKDGRTVDIYELVLHALAHLKPGLVSLEYESLRSAIRDVSAAQIPQLHEVARVLKHMATIAASDQSSTPVIDFEDADKKLHITDPFFAFYLRWGQLAS